jgi:hypothetical protein
MYSRKAFFASLGAPLKNDRWSWGAVRRSDGVVFLMVWQDECKIIGDIRAVRLLNGMRGEKTYSQMGHNERMAHLDLIRAGASAYLVMCKAVDATAPTRTIEHLNHRELFVLGQLHYDGVDTWAEMAGRVPTSALRPSVSQSNTKS